MSDNQKKYEAEAIDWCAAHPDSSPGDTFLAGASFAEKEAHNAAIQKAISIIMEKNHDYPIHHVCEELEKLKL